MKKLNRIFSCIIAVLMLVTVLPTSVLAEDSVQSNAVTVYLTVSNNGYFVNGNDEAMTMMARVPVTVEYFDLAEYGLEKYYRYETDSFEDGGKYKNDTIVEQPTVLHLLIKAIEKYYLDGEKLEVGTNAMNISGAATSMFFKELWGCKSDLMFLTDHKVPFMTQGWSATADYVLLEDGMEIDVGMFSNYNFYYTGGFAYFDQTEYNISVGETVSFRTMKANTDMFSTDFGGAPSQFGGLYTSVSDENWAEIADITETVSDKGMFSYTFDKAGTYFVTAIDRYAGDPDDSSIVPAIAVVNVSEPTQHGGKIYYQKRIDGTDGLRIVAELDQNDVLSSDNAVIRITYEGQTIERTITTACKGIYANGNTIYANEGKCFVVSPSVNGIESDSKLKVEVKLSNFDKGITSTLYIV